MTTLRTYAAWVEQADRRAAETIAQVIPKPAPTPRVRGPYETIAGELREKIMTGELKPGDQLPTIVQLAAQHTVAAGTAHRAMALLQAEGLINAQRGKRAVVLPPICCRGLPGSNPGPTDSKGCGFACGRSARSCRNCLDRAPNF